MTLRSKATLAAVPVALVLLTGTLSPGSLAATTVPGAASPGLVGGPSFEAGETEDSPASDQNPSAEDYFAKDAVFDGKWAASVRGQKQQRDCTLTVTERTDGTFAGKLHLGASGFFSSGEDLEVTGTAPVGDGKVSFEVTPPKKGGAFRQAYAGDVTGGTLALTVSGTTPDKRDVSGTATLRPRSAIRAERQKAAEEARERLAAERASGEQPVLHIKAGDYELKVNGLAFNPNGGLLAGACSDGVVRLWRSATGRQVAAFAGQVGEAVRVAFAPDGKLLAAAGLDGYARVWDVPSRTEVFKLGKHEGKVLWVAFDPQSPRLATGDSTGVVTLWDTGSGKSLLAFPTGAAVGGLSFSPDGKVVATGTDFDVRFWNAATGKGSNPAKRGLSNELHAFSGHFNFVHCVAYSPDGKLVASSGQDATVRVWDVASRKEAFTLKGHGASPVSSLSFSPDGRRLASGSYGQFRRVTVWDVRTGERRPELGDGKTKLDNAFDVAFSPDGERVAVGTNGGVYIWRAGPK